MIAEAGEEFVTVEAFEHSGEELILPVKRRFVEQVMNRAPSEDLHNSLLASQDLAFFEEIHKKASHDQIRECYDDFEGCQT